MVYTGNMKSDDGWAEHRALVLARLSEYGADIKRIEGEIVEIKIATTGLPQLSRDISELMLRWRQPPHYPRTPIRWLRILVSVFSLVSVGGLTALGLTCHSTCGSSAVASHDVKSPAEMLRNDQEIYPEGRQRATPKNH